MKRAFRVVLGGACGTSFRFYSLTPKIDYRNSYRTKRHKHHQAPQIVIGECSPALACLLPYIPHGLAAQFALSLFHRCCAHAPPLEATGSRDIGELQVHAARALAGKRVATGCWGMPGPNPRTYRRMIREELYSPLPRSRGAAW